MPKRTERPDQVEANIIQLKKQRKENNHSADCDDKDCEGCDDGPVEIAFIRAGETEATVEPTANELLSMAKEEQGDTDMARRLFDMALEAFEKEEQGITGVGYAQCLVELGRALSVEESVREGYQLFAAAASSTHTQLWQARAALSLARSIRLQKTKTFDDLRLELEDTDGEIEDEVSLEQLITKDKVTREEMKLYKEAITLLDKILLGVDTLDETTLSLIKQAMHDIREYGETLEQPTHEEHVAVLFDTLIRYIQLFPYESDDTLLTLWAACLLHRQKFVQGKEKELICQRAGNLIEKSKAVYTSKYDKENPLAWELYAMLKMTESNIAEDEDQILSLYDESIQAYKKALELNPGNEELQDMLELLNGTPEEGGDEE